MAIPSSLLLIFVLFIGFKVSSAQFPSTNATLAGVITCPNTSLATIQTFPVIPQARVDVVCRVLFFPRVAKSTTTNDAGVYAFFFGPLDIIFGNLELCHLKVTMPPNSCTFDPPRGALTFPIIAIRSGGLVMDYVPGAPSYVL